MNKNLIPWRRSRELPVRRVEENPFLALHQRMNELFDGFFSDFEEGFTERRAGSLARRSGLAVPTVDVSETDDEVLVTADLPGLTEKDVEVTLDRDVVTIRGSRKEEREEKKKNYHLMERSYGEFHRVIPLPEGIDKDKAKATFKNGVLKLALPKLPEAKAERRHIDVTAE
jgi:HSP20 family protein